MAGQERPFRRYAPTRSSGGATGPGAARRIYQDLVDGISQSLYSGDFDTYARSMALPHKLINLTGQQTLETADDLRRLFDGYRAFLADKGVSTYVRVCLTARFTGPGSIEGTHESHVLRGNAYVRPRFPVRGVLQRQANGWAMTLADARIGDEAGIPFLTQPGADPVADPDTGAEG